MTAFQRKPRSHGSLGPRLRRAYRYGVLGLALSLGLVSCVSNRYHREVRLERPRPSTTGGTVPVFSHAPRRAFSVIALLQTIETAPSQRAAVQRLSLHLQRRAKRLGCQAISHFRLHLGRKDAAGARIVHAYGVCIRYLAPQRGPASSFHRVER